AMPGYEILGIYSSGGPGWQNTDALHCRAKGVADRGMLWVRHMPLWGNISEQTDYIIEATIVPLSGATLYPDSILVYYKIDEGSYASVQMTTQDDTTYIGLIPGADPGSEIAYYIYVADESGKNANHPFIGAPDPHTFIVEPFVDVTVVPDSLVFLDYQQCLEAQPVMVYNLTDTEITINDITPEGWEIFMWIIDPWGITLPYALPPGDSLELLVKIGIPVASMGVLLCDTLFIETNGSTHKVAIKVDSDLVSINDPDHSALLNLTNYPNPFSGSTTIAFEVEEPSKVALEIFNYQGQLINTLLNENLPQGLHSVTWNGTDYNGDAVSSGIYIYRLRMKKTASMKKMLLMK
ncbi:MAG: T9SS type A sorting domain-containing protein, partial [Bacteroidales bacterium]|nr:T9SS type A sorting domain-containing protein [Bacteroidales bacterium]